MFNCERCKKTTKEGQPTNKVVVEKREAVYTETIKRGKRKGEKLYFKGEEIVKEIDVCPDCYIAMTGLKPVLGMPKAKAKPKRQYKPGSRKQNKQWRNPKDRKGSRSHRKSSSGHQTSTSSQDTKKSSPVVTYVNKR